MEQRSAARAVLAGMCTPFFWFHVATAVMVVLVGVPSLFALGLCVATYYLRMFAITGGLHRYFSHRTFKTSRLVQGLFALGAASTLQRGVLWWAAKHRHHHRHSDTDKDVHSPLRQGLAWAHMGWITSSIHDETPIDQIKDFARYPELRLLDHRPVWVGVFSLFTLALLLTLGFEAMVWGSFVSTALLWHGTFTINSLSHVWGRRVYGTSDTSRNNGLLALITLGEGWHNNHHYYPTSCAQGFRWWELDVTYRVLWLMERVGLVWDLKHAPAEVVGGRLGGRDWLLRPGERDPGLDPAPVAAPAAAEPVAEPVAA